MILKDYMAVVKSVSFKDSALSWLGNLGQVTEMFYDCVLLRILGLLCLLVIVSQDCCNKLPHVSGLRQHTYYYLTVVEAGSPKSASLG